MYIFFLNQLNWGWRLTSNALKILGIDLDGGGGGGSKKTKAAEAKVSKD
jgi:hypothetical protein